MGQGGLAAQIGSARIDLMHQIETLHVEFVDAAQIDGAGVVDQNIDAAKGFDGFLHRRLDLIVEADIAGQRQRLAAGRFNLRRRRIDRAGDLGIFRNAFRRNGDLCAIARGAFGDGETDATAGAGDEKRFAFERAGHGAAAA